MSMNIFLWKSNDVLPLAISGNKIEYQGDTNNKPVTIGKKKYCQCTREWRFWIKEKNIATRIQ